MYFYAYDSYDLTAALGDDGNRLIDAETGTGGYQVAYSVDWTGLQLHLKGDPTIDIRKDADNQLKYPNAPLDRTVLTACTYHMVIAHTDKCPVMFINGTVKPVDGRKFFKYGWDVANY